VENVGKTIRYPKSNYIRHRLIVELLDDFLALHQRLSEPEAKRKKTNMSEEILSSDIGCGRIDNLRFGNLADEKLWKTVYEIRLMKKNSEINV
jgi:hypothetical protein